MATLTQLHEYGNLIAILDDAGNRVLAYSSNTGDYWNIADNNNGALLIERYGGLLSVLFDDGERAFCYPTSSTSWIVQDTGDHGTPVLEWVWPLSVPPWNWGKPYGPDSSSDGFHYGLDINGAGILGTDIWCASDGTVRTRGTNSGHSYGYYLLVEHTDGSGTFYAHMQSASPFTVGSSVNVADVIGYVGSTGDSTGPHLHFNTQTTYTPAFNGNTQNPQTFMSNRNAIML